MPPDHADIAIIGAGAAGLMAAIWAGRAARERGLARRIIALDGARSLGAKILVAGGGRCNVTHHHVDESAYAGSSRHAIKKVLRSFDVPSTISFFREIGVDLKREETGKLFPVTDSARSVLSAMLDECRRLGIELIHPWRVDTIERARQGFIIREAQVNFAEARDPKHEARTLSARRVILATGGRSLPKSGSDGRGYDIARSLGHSMTERIFPALVPLLLPAGHFLRELSGIALPATLTLVSPTGKRLNSFTNSTLCTHFGLSGPCVLDISRYYLDARLDAEAGANRLALPKLLINFMPGITPETLDAQLQGLGKRTPLALLRESLPERLAASLCAAARIDTSASGATLTRESRRALVRTVTELELPICGDRGYTYAEVTAGGVPLAELQLNTMESRICPGLHIIGEICDVDGRIGGFNFQWAWASGYLSGLSAGLMPMELP